MYQHVNHATMVTLLEEARIPFLREPFGAEIDDHRPADRRCPHPLQGAVATDRFAAAGDDVVEAGAGRRLHHRLRSAVGQRPPDSKPAVIAETQLAAVHIKEQRLQRLSESQREYLQQWMR